MKPFKITDRLQAISAKATEQDLADFLIGTTRVSSNTMWYGTQFQFTVKKLYDKDSLLLKTFEDHYILKLEKEDAWRQPAGKEYEKYKYQYETVHKDILKELGVNLDNN